MPATPTTARSQVSAHAPPNGQPNNRLSDMLEEEEQKLVYTFDPINDRVFYIELTDIVTGKSLDKAQCTQSRGEAPKQLQGFDLDFSNLSKKNDRDIDLDFDNYGTEGYNDDEYDPSSYSIDDNY